MSDTNSPCEVAPAHATVPEPQVRTGSTDTDLLVGTFLRRYGAAFWRILAHKPDVSGT